MKETYEKYIQEGWLDCQRHPEYPLLILDYSRQTQFERKWDQITLKCRGLVTTEDFIPVNNPLPKFFNMEELATLPMGKFKTFDKLDGSCGTTYYWGGQHHIATRGSFASEQALFADNLLKTKYAHIGLNPNLTYVFEIIYPENWIVVRYDGLSDIVLTAVRDANGDLDINEFKNIGFSVVQEYPHRDFKQMKQMNLPNKEGFVVLFESGERMKIKFTDYCELHANRFNLSSKTVFCAFEQNIPVGEFIEGFPDEFDTWITKTHGGFESQYLGLFEGIFQLWLKVNHIGDKKTYVEATKALNPTRLQFGALMVLWGDKPRWDSLHEMLIKSMKSQLEFEKGIPLV